MYTRRQSCTLAEVIASLTIACDWPGCPEQLTYDFRLLQPDPKHGWKTEPNADAFACHLCPAHKRKGWEEVKAAKVKASGAAPGQYPW